MVNLDERERTPGMKYFTVTVEIVIKAENECQAASALESILSPYEGGDGTLVYWAFYNPQEIERI